VFVLVKTVALDEQAVAATELWGVRRVRKINPSCGKWARPGRIKPICNPSRPPSMQKMAQVEPSKG